MKFNNLMHVTFNCENFDEMYDFYVNKLGLEPKIIVRNRAYLDKPSHSWYKQALENPNGIAMCYVEIAPGQFIELFPKNSELLPHSEWNTEYGYSHFALVVDDIHKTRDELAANGVEIDVEPNIGNSHTWQMWIHDPEGNKFEIMQYTPDSFQITGHLDPEEA